jgi:hypothetical protein
MQTPFTNHPSVNLPGQVRDAASGFGEGTLGEDTAALKEESIAPFIFRGGYVGSMDMAANRQIVVEYLDAHQDWFRRCARPMTADPIGETGYALTVGHFGALGYDVEPRIGLNLLPQERGVYRIETIPVPGYVPQGYDVDFNAEMELKEIQRGNDQVMTQVGWVLDLAVQVQFPRFINALPKALIQKTGDHLLNQVVRQVSRCLTHKVQEDFHTTLGLTLPESFNKRHHHFLERFSRLPQSEG